MKPYSFKVTDVPSIMTKGCLGKLTHFVAPLVLGLLRWSFDDDRFLFEILICNSVPPLVSTDVLNSRVPFSRKPSFPVWDFDLNINKSLFQSLKGLAPGISISGSSTKFIGCSYSQ